MYVLMTVFLKKRVWIVLGFAAVFLAAGLLPFREIVTAVNWNVLLMITGTMVLVEYFIMSKMPNLMADMLLDRSRNVMWVTIYMSLFSGVISAFMDNVATVLMVAPVGLAICKKLNISPVGMILSIAVSSNLQGAATLVGDTTSIMLGAYAHMDFLDFFWMNGRPGIFFAVELGALATIPIMMFLFRKDKDPVEADVHTKVEDKMPTILLLAMIAALILASFNKNKPEITNGLICCAFAVAAVIYDWLRTRDPGRMKRSLRSIDFETLLLLFGLFIVIGGVTNVGLIDSIAGLIAGTPSNESITHLAISGAVDLSEALTNSQYESAIKAGMLTFSKSAAGAVWVEQGINTLVTPGTKEDEGWKKIKRTKVRFELFQRLNDSVEGLVGRINNDADGRMTVVQVGNNVCNEMIAEKKLMAGAYVELDPNYTPQGDSAWFIVYADDIDALEKLYFAFKFRFAPED